MKVILKAILCSTLLLGINSAQAGIVDSTREALRYFQTSVSPLALTAEERTFLIEMVETKNSLKFMDEIEEEFLIDVAFEGSLYFDLIKQLLGVLAEVRVYADAVSSLADDLSDTKNANYLRALKTLRLQKDTYDTKDFLNRINSLTRDLKSLLATYTFWDRDFLKGILGIKTAYAYAGGISTAVNEARQIILDVCTKRGPILGPLSCAANGGNWIIKDGAENDFFPDGKCCEKGDKICECDAKGRQPVKGKCCKKDDKKCMCIANGGSPKECDCEKDDAECKCLAQDKNWINGQCCEKDSEECECNAEGKEWKNGVCCGNSQADGGCHCVQDGGVYFPPSPDYPHGKCCPKSNCSCICGNDTACAYMCNCNNSGKQVVPTSSGIACCYKGQVWAEYKAPVSGGGGSGGGSGNGGNGGQLCSGGSCTR